MTIKELLLQEIESTPESLLGETLNFLRYLKTKQPEIQSLPQESQAEITTEQIDLNETSTDNSQQSYRPASGRSILKHVGTWAGDDLEECLQSVYATRGKAKFDYDNPFDK
jgi:hypothetical protein